MTMLTKEQLRELADAGVTGLSLVREDVEVAVAAIGAMGGYFWGALKEDENVGIRNGQPVSIKARRAYGNVELEDGRKIAIRIESPEVVTVLKAA